MSKLNNHQLEKIESSTPSLKLNLIRDYPSKEPKAILICHHGIILTLKFYEPFVKPMNEANIILYRYDARGHGDSEGKRGYVKSFFEMVEDLKIVVDLAKKENPNLAVFIIGHSMGGHVSALFGTKYSNEVNGIILCSGLLKDTIKVFGGFPQEGEPEKYVSIIDAFKPKEVDENLVEILAKAYPNFLREITYGIINAFGDGLDYLKNNVKNFIAPALVLNGNIDFLVNEKDAINFYMDLENQDKSLIIYSKVGHMVWFEEKGDMIIENILAWIQHRIK